ncbi:MAG: penicillin-binding protein 2 [Patescibacteria group bacterium]
MWQESHNRLSTNRIRIAAFFVLAVFLFIGFKLFNLQVWDSKRFKELSSDLIFSQNRIEKRGEVYFSPQGGRPSTAASTKKGYLLYINPKILEDSASAFLALSSFFALDEEDFFAKSQKKNDPFEILKKRLENQDSEIVESWKIKGVGTVEDKWRFYPGGSAASHVLGFAAENAGEWEGKYGIEKFYENELSSGEDVHLTIEPSVQVFAELELKNFMEKWNGASGGVAVVNPKNGDILAMAALPNFDPNKFQEEKNLQVFLNPFSEKIFELGSIMKPITMASALDSGSISPNTEYFDKGFVEVSGKRLNNFDGKGRGLRNMTQVLEESLNTGAVFAMQRMGKETFRDYLLKFGFGQKTGIDLPGEIKSNLRNLDSGREIEFATASFGQGIAVTPISMISALSALANGGKVVFPHLKVLDSKSQEGAEAISEKASQNISKILVDVVDNTLAGGTAKIDGYSIAAKTGTAQIPDYKNGGYGDEFLHSFFGYFPAYDAKFLIFLFLEKPVGVRYASQTLTEPFTNITKFLINYYTVPPDR